MWRFKEIIVLKREGLQAYIQGAKVTLVPHLQGTPVMTESDLATLVLNMLITMCRYFPSRTEDQAVIRPLPRIKRLLSDSISLPHIVQLLLTFDPVLVEKVSSPKLLFKDKEGFLLLSKKIIEPKQVNFFFTFNLSFLLE